jgi:WD40 repeat protein
MKSILLVLMQIMFTIFIFEASAADLADPPLLRIETGQHTALTPRIATDKSGRWLVTASHDKTVRIFDTSKIIANKKQEKASLDSSVILRPPIGVGNEGKMYSVAISPDGSLIACAGWTKSVRKFGYSLYIFSRKDGKLLAQVNKIYNVILDLAFSPNGRLLAASLGGNEGLLIFSVDKVAPNSGISLRLVGRDSNYGDSSYSVDFSNDSLRLLTISYDGFARQYNTKDIKEYSADIEIKPVIKRLLLGGKRPYVAKYSPDSSKIAVAFSDSRRVGVFSASNFKKLYDPFTDDLDSSIFYSLAWSPDGNVLYAGGQHGVAGFVSYIRGWSDAGRGNFYDLASGAVDTILDIVTLPNGVLAFSGPPTIGIISPKGDTILSAKSSRGDFRANQEQLFISENALTIRFSYLPKGKSLAKFSVLERKLTSISQDNGKLSVDGMLPAKIGSMQISGWKATTSAELNGIKISLDPEERSLSLAIAHDNKSFLLGCDWSLRKFNNYGKELWRVDVPSSAHGVNITPFGETAIASFADGTIRWFRYDDGKELLAFFPHTDHRRWILWTPEGYFDASPDGAELIGYHLNQGMNKEAKFIPMSQLYDVFYRPDIIQAKLKGEDISSLVILTAEEALKTPPPEVKFTLFPNKPADKSVKVCYQIKSTGGGIGEVRLFQNGKLIKSDGFYREVAKKEASDKIEIASLNSQAIYQNLRGLVVREKKLANTAISKPKGDLVDECVEIETIAGENEISLAAFNAPNTVQSFMETATFVANRKVEAPHLYILSVGIDTYSDSSINLKYAAKDARDFIAKLPQKARSIYKPQNIHIVNLTNQPATKQNILKAIDELAAKVRNGDGFIFFNASHGVLLQNQYYIVTTGFDGSLDDTSNLIGSNEIVEMSKRIKSLSQLFIFDTCHAGGVDNIISGLYDARMVNLARKMGLHIYASAGSVQTAMDGYKGNGLYTYTLLEGLAHGTVVDKNKSGVVTIKSLGEYTKTKTSEISSKLGHQQVPIIINFGQDKPLFKAY